MNSAFFICTRTLNPIELNCKMKAMNCSFPFPASPSSPCPFLCVNFKCFNLHLKFIFLFAVAGALCITHKTMKRSGMKRRQRKMASERENKKLSQRSLENTNSIMCSSASAGGNLEFHSERVLSASVTCACQTTAELNAPSTIEKLLKHMPERRSEFVRQRALGLSFTSLIEQLRSQ